MGRYYDESSTKSSKEEGTNPSNPKEEVFNISHSVIRKVKHNQSFKPERNKGQSYQKKKGKKKDKFPGKKPIDPLALERHSRGDKVDTEKVKTKFKKKEQERREKKIEYAAEQSARAEFLLDEDAGFLEGDETQEFTAQIKQSQIKSAVDEESAAKCFDLHLPQFGPYKISYTRNGRFLLLGGRRGHIAAFDWTSKALKCEINAMESVHDVQWLHTENMFAVAQKKWTYFYDNQGIEIHCVKKLDHVTSLEYLPYHFLLAAASERGGLSWLDVSIGKIVTQTYTKLGRLDVMTQNPSNAVLVCGHSKGTVTMWTPSMKEPAAKILVHRQPVRAVAVERSGNYMATAAIDRSVKIWDLRAYKCLHEYQLGGGASKLAFSQRGLLVASLGNKVEIYPDPTKGDIGHPYMKHEVFKGVSDIGFCPYEDVLGIGHGAGFSSILVPGSGEPNFDALEVNPYQTVSQRKEAEVKLLMDKIAPELITLDGDALGGVDVPTLQDKIDERNKKIFIKPSNIEFDPRNKMKGKGGSAKRHHIRRTVIEESRNRNLKKDLEGREERREGQEKKEAPVYKNVLDRFRT